MLVAEATIKDELRAVSAEDCYVKNGLMSCLRNQSYLSIR